MLVSKYGIWQHYHKSIVYRPVLCYNVEKDSFEFHKPTKDFIYDNKYPTYHIKSDHTDQIMSRNHSILVERDGKKSIQICRNMQILREYTLFGKFV